jgi:hypothetical protein
MEAALPSYLTTNRRQLTMANLTSLHGPRPVATVPTSASYRTQPGRLVTFVGFVRPSFVTGFATTRPDTARQAA